MRGFRTGRSEGGVAVTRTGSARAWTQERAAGLLAGMPGAAVRDGEFTEWHLDLSELQGVNSSLGHPPAQGARSQPLETLNSRRGKAGWSAWSRTCLLVGAIQ